MPTTPVIDTDLYLAFPEFADWITVAAGDDWSAVADIVNDLPDASSRILAICQMTAAGESEKLFARAVEQADSVDQTGADTLPKVLLAARHIEIGWTARTGFQAKRVSREQFATFHHHLRLAEQLLIDVIAHEPDNVPAWYFRLLTARGLELGLSEVRRRYDRLARHDPHCYPAQGQFLQSLCPKWSGDWDSASVFVDTCDSTAPPGAVNHAMVAELHVEKWLEFDEGQDEAHLRQESVRAELVAAASRSAWHPGFPRDYFFYRVHGYFAAALALGGHHQDAAPHFEVIDGHLDRYPWIYLGDPRSSYQKLCAASLGKG